MIIKLFFGKGTKAIGNYLGIIDSLEIKVKKLVKSELNSGILALKQAQNSQAERDSLLREARSKLNKAIYLEKEERLVAAYLGLALCHFLLNDTNNSIATLKEFAEQNIELNLQRKISSSVTGEVGYALEDAANFLTKLFDNKRFSKIQNNLFLAKGNFYLQKLEQQGEKLSDSYYQGSSLTNRIKDYQQQALILSEELPKIGSNQIELHHIKQLSGLLE